MVVGHQAQPPQEAEEGAGGLWGFLAQVGHMAGGGGVSQACAYTGVVPCRLWPAAAQADGVAEGPPRL